MTGIQKFSSLSVEEIVEEMDRQLPVAPADSVLKEMAPITPYIRGGIVNVPQLLTLSPPDFVNTAYRDIFGREPDNEGFHHHLQMLAAGHDKQNMLIGMRESEEGKRYNSTLIGIRHKSRIDRLFEKPIIGRLSRIFITRLPAYRFRQHVRNIEDMVRGLNHAVELQQLSIVDLAERLSHSATQRQFDALSTRVDAGRVKLDEQRKAAEAAIRRLVIKAAEQFSKEPWVEPILLIADRQEEVQQQLFSLNRALADVELVNDAVRSLEAAFGPVAKGSSWTETGAALVAKSADALRLQESRIHKAEELARVAHTEMVEQARRLTLLIETVRRRAQPMDDGQVSVFIEEQDHLLDPLYVEFEARFRGSRELIKIRQEVHLPTVRHANAGSEDRPVIDVGAGRGEWLELLKDERLSAKGIDLSVAMAAFCNELDLTCAQGDAVTELAKLPANSAGAVTAFHLIEHLPFRVMVALFDEAFRVLSPGGVIIFETPNPANLQVGSRWFYLDPTHRNPLPAEMVAMIAEARGFVRIRIQELHPMPTKFDSSDKILGEQLDALLHGPMDYALIAYKA